MISAKMTISTAVHPSQLVALLRPPHTVFGRIKQAFGPRGTIPVDRMRPSTPEV